MSQPGEPGEGERTSLGSRTLQHRAIPEERPSDLHWSAATSGGCGGLCPPAAWHTTALDVRHEPASFPCWRSACHSPWEPPSCVRMALQDEQPRAPLRGGDSPATEEAQGGSGAVPRSRQGGEAALYRQERMRSAKPLGEGGKRCVRRICYRAWHKRWCRGVHMTGRRGEGSGAGSAETG